MASILQTSKSISSKLKLFVSVGSEDASKASTSCREGTQFWMEDSYGLNEGERLRQAVLTLGDDEFLLFHKVYILRILALEYTVVAYALWD